MYLQLIVSLVLFNLEVQQPQSPNSILSIRTQFREEICLDWNFPDSTNLLDVVNSMKPQNSYQIHESFKHYKCSLIGEMTYEGKKYMYFLNAGGHLTLQLKENSSERLFFGIEKGSAYENLFLYRKFTNEEMNKMMDQEDY